MDKESGVGEIIRRVFLAGNWPGPILGGGQINVGGRHDNYRCESWAFDTRKAKSGGCPFPRFGPESVRFYGGDRPSPQSSGRLVLAGGVVPVLADLSGTGSEAGSGMGARLVAEGALPASSVILLVSITPDLTPGPSNFLKLQRV